MPAQIVLQPTPDAAILPGMRRKLTAVRSALAEQAAELDQLRAQLEIFEARYLREVGMLYVELDDLEARIVEREADLYDSDSARRRAQSARQRAQATYDVAFSQAEEAEEIEPPQNLKSLFRELARRIHPDLAKDETEQKHLTYLMILANQAYSRGDVDRLQRLLDDHREINFALEDESTATELIRITRQIQHAERDLAALELEKVSLAASEIGQLHVDAEAAACENRDLVTELVASLGEQIQDARHRLEFVERQVFAHGR